MLVLLCLAKNLGGGFLVSEIIGKAKIMDTISLGGTYAGSPLGIAAGLEVLKIIEDEKLLERSNTLGKELKNMPQSLKHKEIMQMKGLGSMTTIKLHKDRKPNAKLAKIFNKRQ